jgi:hypothetical protein
MSNTRQRENSMPEATAEFQVAILIEDISEAKIISDGLREVGIFAHYYTELNDLWVALGQYTPDLCIVDVKMMSQGTLLFKHHAKVKSNQLKYCFYYKESTKVLLNSTHGMNHYGLIRAEVSITDQLKSVLRRRDEELRLIEENETMEKRVERLKLRGKRLVEAHEANHEERTQHNKLRDLIKNFGTVKTPNDYLNRVISFFNDWDECINFGMYHLNSTNQKLIAPKAKKTNYRILPDLWLASECTEGISDYAADMAYDVSYGLIDDDLLTLKIYGVNDNPDILIIGHFDQKNLAAFEWDLLETKLNSEYRKSLIHFHTRHKTEKFEENIYSTFQHMDDIQYHQVQSDYKFVMVDFSRLIDFISTNLENRFHWRAFYREFTSELSDVLSKNFKVSSYDSGHFIVSLDKTNIEIEFQKLKLYVDEFQVWRYFEDTTIMLSGDMAPAMKFIAPSSVNVIRQAKDKFSPLMEKQDMGVTSRNLEV